MSGRLEQESLMVSAMGSRGLPYHWSTPVPCCPRSSGMVSLAPELLKASPEYVNRQSTTPDSANFDDSGNAIIRCNAGDILQSLAQKAYGDSALWYVIAEANGVLFNTDLSGLKTIVIPDAPAPNPQPGTDSFLSAVSSAGTAGGTWTGNGMLPMIAIPRLAIPNVAGAAVRYGATPIPSGSRSGAQPAGLIVQINPGDTVPTLAQRAHGDARYADLIVQQNRFNLQQIIPQYYGVEMPPWTRRSEHRALPRFHRKWSFLPVHLNHDKRIQ